MPFGSPLDFLAQGASKRGGETVLVLKERSWTWAGFHTDVLAAAGTLMKQGFRPGMRAALVSSDYGGFFTYMFAVWAAGGIVAPVNTTLPAANRRVILDKLKPHLCIFGKDDAHLDEGAGPAFHPAGETPAVDLPAPLCRPAPTDDAVIMFTSGTTGVPKGVQNTHAAVAANAALTAARIGVRPDDRILINTPPYYTSAVVHLLTMFAAGAGLAAGRGFMFGDDLLHLMDRFGCTGFGGAPVSIGRLAAASADAPRPELLRFFISSGDHLPSSVIGRTLGRFPGVRLHTVYGLTEVAGRLCFLPPGRLPEKAGSVGRPLDGMTVRVLREDGLDPCPPGEVGQVYVQGPLLTRGYFEDERAGLDLKTGAGFRTGDFAFLDDEGLLWLQGRRDDIFKSGGEKVSTLMIQEVLLAQTDFNDLAVVPVEDEVLGRVPGVYYVSGENGFDRRSLVRRLKSLLPANHVPKRFIRVESIPRTGSGKVVRRDLPPV